MNRRQLIRGYRAALQCAISKRDAIRYGLVVSACRSIPGQQATALGCLRAADNIADALDDLYPSSPTLANRLAGMVSRGDWPSLWESARAVVYPNVCG